MPLRNSGGLVTKRYFSGTIRGNREVLFALYSPGSPGSRCRNAIQYVAASIAETARTAAVRNISFVPQHRHRIDTHRPPRWTQARAAARAFARHVGLPLQPLTVLVYFCQHAFAHGLGGPCAARNDANKISTAGTTSITNRFFSLSMVKTSLKIWHPLWTLS